MPELRKGLGTSSMCRLAHYVKATHVAVCKQRPGYYRERVVANNLLAGM